MWINGFSLKGKAKVWPKHCSPIFGGSWQTVPLADHFCCDGVRLLDWAVIIEAGSIHKLFDTTLIRTLSRFIPFLRLICILAILDSVYDNSRFDFIPISNSIP